VRARIESDRAAGSNSLAHPGNEAPPLVGEIAGLQGQLGHNISAIL
jgi:hypothetical protein